MCNTENPCSESVKLKATHQLREVLNKEQMWVKVHAAEYLLWSGLDTGTVRKVFLTEEKLHSTEPKYRVGIQRVLAQTQEDTIKRNERIKKILAIFGNLHAPDRIHATETLAKLKTSPFANYPEVTAAALQDANPIMQTYTLWASSFTSADVEKANNNKFKKMALTNPDSTIRKISAYILQKSKVFDANEWKLFATKALEASPTSGLKNSLLNTSFITYPGGNDKTFELIRTEMKKGWNATFSAQQLIEMAQALAERGICKELPILDSIMNNKNVGKLYDPESAIGADVRAAAAYAILKIIGRSN